MGIVQHHDAVSGTERQHVADDYAQRLSYGIDRTVVIVYRILYSLTDFICLKIQ